MSWRLWSGAFLATGSFFLEEAFGLTDGPEDEEDFTQLAGLSLDDPNGQEGSRIDWDSQFTG